MQEDQTRSNSRKAHVSLAGPNPKHMDDEFLMTAYRKVHENLKLIIDERVIKDNPESHSGSIAESDSTIPDPSHQTVTSTPPVIDPFTDVSSTKPSSLVTPPPINTEATTIILFPNCYPNLHAFSKSTTRAHRKIDQGSSA
ncbi:hypothetical protein Tco_0159515 [Tanacetum coccineum]